MLDAFVDNHLTDDEALESIRQIMARKAPPTVAEIVAGGKRARLEGVIPLALVESQGDGASPARCRELEAQLDRLQYNMLVFSTGGRA